MKVTLEPVITLDHVNPEKQYVVLLKHKHKHICLLTRHGYAGLDNVESARYVFLIISDPSCVFRSNSYSYDEYDSGEDWRKLVKRVTNNGGEVHVFDDLASLASFLQEAQ